MDTNVSDLQASKEQLKCRAARRRSVAAYLIRQHLWSECIQEQRTLGEVAKVSRPPVPFSQFAPRKDQLACLPDSGLEILKRRNQIELNSEQRQQSVRLKEFGENFGLTLLNCLIGSNLSCYYAKPRPNFSIQSPQRTLITSLGDKLRRCYCECGRSRSLPCTPYRYSPEIGLLMTSRCCRAFLVLLK